MRRGPCGAKHEAHRGGKVPARATAAVTCAMPTRFVGGDRLRAICRLGSLAEGYESVLTVSTRLMSQSRLTLTRPRRSSCKKKSRSPATLASPVT